METTELRTKGLPLKREPLRMDGEWAAFEIETEDPLAYAVKLQEKLFPGQKYDNRRVEEILRNRRKV